MTPKELQNTEEALLLQATARYYYNKASNYDLVIWGIAIILPTFKLVFPNAQFLTFLLVVGFIVSLFLEDTVEKKSNQASEYKLLFDKIVFGFETPANEKERLIFKAEALKRNNLTFFTVQMNGDGSSRGIKSWYNNLDSIKAFQNQYKESQVETSDYDSKISKLLKILFVLVAVSFLSVLFIMNAGLNDTMMFAFVSFATLTKKIIQTWKNLNKEVSIRNKVNKFLSKNSITTEESYELLKLVDEKRKVLLPIKKFVYPAVHPVLEKYWTSLNG